MEQSQEIQKEDFLNEVEISNNDDIPHSFINVYLDIETLPAGELLQPEQISVPGNYSKPESIKAYQESQVATEYLKRSLIAHKGRIFCIVVYDDKNREFKTFVDDNNEELVIKQFNDYILSFDIKERSLLRFIGFNIAEFDLSWLILRAWRYDLPFRHYFPSDSRSPRIIDLMHKFGAYKYKQFISMNDVCEYFGIYGSIGGDVEFDEVDGSMTYDLYMAGKRDLIIKHCLVDVQKLIKVNNKMI